MRLCKHYWMPLSNSIAQSSNQNYATLVYPKAVNTWVVQFLCTPSYLNGEKPNRCNQFVNDFIKYNHKLRLENYTTAADYNIW